MPENLKRVIKILNSHFSSDKTLIWKCFTPPLCTSWKLKSWVIFLRTPLANDFLAYYSLSKRECHIGFWESSAAGFLSKKMRKAFPRISDDVFPNANDSENSPLIPHLCWRHAITKIRMEIGQIIRIILLAKRLVLHFNFQSWSKEEEGGKIENSTLTKKQKIYIPEKMMIKWLLVAPCSRCNLNQFFALALNYYWWQITNYCHCEKNPNSLTLIL